ncbi:YchJ family protein [Marinifilum sp. D737]|jgi:SEC-C motif-containing protein|uniref:YchJ family protein n=1 Tax=Marinifilum sp. D737 TaxID=2969628 RepID=UPI0022727897|nr:YchJ family protein [Marinifilum sp. D737]MCY1634090.1 YchJ family protein [Marinifilum sp. D737]
MSSPCYCGKSNSYEECCGTIHSGKRKTETAEDLMRSRYSAFVIADIAYILKTYSSKTRPLNQEKEILDWAKSVDWKRLDVVNTNKGNSMDDNGHVEFKAYYKEDGIDQCLHENSFFEKENEQWVYVSGEYPKEEKPNLPNRNDPCCCGSGKKFKKCCFGKI